MRKKDRKRVSPKLMTALVGLSASTVLLGILLLGTNPDKVGPLGVTSVFGLFLIVIFSTLVLIKMILQGSVDVNIRGLVTIALIPTLILALRTLKQLTPLDVVLLLVFALLFNFYMKRSLSK